jgi:hypothetical protein
VEHVHRPDASRADVCESKRRKRVSRVARFAPHDSIQRRLVVPVHAPPPARARGRRDVRRDLEPEPALEKLAPQRVVRRQTPRATTDGGETRRVDASLRGEIRGRRSASRSASGTEVEKTRAGVSAFGARIRDGLPTPAPSRRVARTLARLVVARPRTTCTRTLVMTSSGSQSMGQNSTGGNDSVWTNWGCTMMSLHCTCRVAGASAEAPRASGLRADGPEPVRQHRRLAALMASGSRREDPPPGTAPRLRE